jgi:hypothetical protein
MVASQLVAFSFLVPASIFSVVAFILAARASRRTGIPLYKYILGLTDVKTSYDSFEFKVRIYTIVLSVIVGFLVYQIGRNVFNL